MKILFILIAVFAGLQVVVRLWPLPAVPWLSVGSTPEPSELVTFGGYYARRGDVSFVQLKNRISATPRVQILKEDHHIVALYRSWFWGFPDVIELWENAGVVHISGHSVIGLWDWGSNKNRIQSWLDG